MLLHPYLSRDERVKQHARRQHPGCIIDQPDVVFWRFRTRRRSWHRTRVPQNTSRCQSGSRSPSYAATAGIARPRRMNSSTRSPVSSCCTASRPSSRISRSYSSSVSGAEPCLLASSASLRNSNSRCISSLQPYWKRLNARHQSRVGVPASFRSARTTSVLPSASSSVRVVSETSSFSRSLVSRSRCFGVSRLSQDAASVGEPLRPLILDRHHQPSAQWRTLPRRGCEPHVPQLDHVYCRGHQLAPRMAARRMRAVPRATTRPRLPRPGSCAALPMRAAPFRLARRTLVAATALAANSQVTTATSKAEPPLRWTSRPHVRSGARHKFSNLFRRHRSWDQRPVRRLGHVGTHPLCLACASAASLVSNAPHEPSSGYSSIT